MTCREEVLEAIRGILRRSGADTFDLRQVLDEMNARGTSYSEATIRTHVASRMCANAPDNHAAVYDDLIRIGHVRYRLAR